MKEEKSKMYEGIGCGCMILSWGIALFLLGVGVEIGNIVKIIWK